MLKRSKLRLNHFFILFFALIIPQKTMAWFTDSTLSLDQYLSIIRSYHPVVKLADLNIDKSVASLKIAKSAFTPLLNHSYSSKSLSGTSYYNYQSAQLRIPTWYGIEVVTGTEYFSGERLNENQTIGITSYTGVNIPLLKNLIFDKRRADVQQSKIYLNLSDVEKQIAMNAILYEAITDYLNWVKSFNIYQVVKENLRNNEERIIFVKQSYFLGERAAMDTIEAMAQLLKFKLLENEKYIDLQQAVNQLSAYTWDENSQPYQLPINIKPVKTDLSAININEPVDVVYPEEFNFTNHAYLQAIKAKTTLLKIEQRLKRQEYLPKFDLQFNALGKNYKSFSNTPQALVLQDNYLFGLKMEVPLTLLKARGENKLIGIKLNEMELTRRKVENELSIKIRNYYLEYTGLKKQIGIQKENVNNYKALLEAEKTKFENGESTLFLVNNRENKSLEEMEKLIELQTKFYKSIFSIEFAKANLK